jgi:mersacidin/lichenicidin family type 2 lantibiotic
MSVEDIIQAWKADDDDDKDDDDSKAPENPAGEEELTDEELKEAAGGLMNPTNYGDACSRPPAGGGSC